MKNWFSNLLKPARDRDAGNLVPPVQAGPSDQPARLLDLQKENQSLRMDLETSQQSIATLKQEIERLRLRQDQVIAETVESRLSGLFSDLAGPASQILTQADLLEGQAKPVQARDVLSVARRMVRALERQGIAFAGQVGEQVIFDPNQHTPINEAVQPQAGQPVVIRFAGVTYRGKIIYKAIVE
jgi:molecular chaperone GrpE (heat shock protein)